MKDDTEVRESQADVPEAEPDLSSDESRGRGADGVEAEVEELREELETLNDQHLRLAAEFNNYRRRNERERSALATRLQADLVSSLLDVLDDLQRVAGSGADVKAETVLEGVKLVERKFTSILEGAGLEPMDAEGEPFDPEVMEALMTVPTDDPGKDDRVADVFQRGYRFRDTMIRPARVRVWQFEEDADRRQGDRSGNGG